MPLHGSMGADEQDRVLAPSRERKVILATNLAETSLTVDGVTDVLDSGLHKVLRFDPATGIDRLQLERISRDSADQRAGRAGRTGPGRVRRLWDPRDHLREHREPEIARVDLSGPVLDVLAWGGDPGTFEWFEAPPESRVAAAVDLLTALGAVADGRMTPLGETLRRLPLHPRLARVLLGAGGAPEAAAACAVLSEGWTRGGVATVATDSDVLLRADAIGDAPPGVRRAAAEIGGLAERVLGRATGRAPGERDERLRRALLAGFPDRVAKRRSPGSSRLLMASGGGAVLAAESGVRSGEWLVAVEVTAGGKGPTPDALVRVASRIEREWIEPSRSTIDHVLDATSGAVRAFERAWLGALVVSERPVGPDPEIAAGLLADAVRTRGLDDEARAFLRRIRFAEIPWDEEAWIRRACMGRTTLEDVALSRAVPREVSAALDRLAPAVVALPRGRRGRLKYRDDGGVALPVRLQELFGLAETPRIGPRSEPVLLVLLSPGGRPVQTTRDLRSFWERVYPEVRKELRARYPKHDWPLDPRNATSGRPRRPGRTRPGG